ncbi:MAG TPA: alpha-E domain-containing protein, partial [Myxococcota bacterium]|nr:alpha-E domain-containing protein [Myxococcota bacterium]
MMLARHAEDLFWAGRYIERAEDTARLLDVTYHGLLESPLLDAESAWCELLELLYLDQAFEAKGLPVTASAVTEFLVLDPDNAGSIVRSVARARDNARNVRERISTELWEAINTLFLELRARDLRADLEREPYQLYGFVKSRCHAISGVSAETMSRDDGWRFFLLGR